MNNEIANFVEVKNSVKVTSQHLLHGCVKITIAKKHKGGKQDPDAMLAMIALRHLK